MEKNYLIIGEQTMPGRYLCGELRADGGAAAAAAGTLFICDSITGEQLDAIVSAGAEEGPGLSGGFSNIVYLSSHEVYSPEAGEGVDESRPAFAWTEAGKRHARTELMLEKWCAARGITLTIARPAIMFGTGVDGPMLSLFNRVIRGHYVHRRGNDAKVSLVTALDVARCLVKLAGHPGIFNISDGLAHRWIDIVEAMTANAGARKRMTHLPEKWIRFLYRWFGRLPIVEECLSPDALEPFGRTCVLSNAKVVEAIGHSFYNTLTVIDRTDPSYPFRD